MSDSRIEVPEGCGSAVEWRAELERLIGAPAASIRGSAPETTVHITRLGPAEFELDLGVGDERRRLRDPSCRVLWRSALVIAAAASRQEAESPPPPDRTPPTGLDATPVPPPRAPSASPRAPARAASPRPRAASGAQAAPVSPRPSPAVPATTRADVGTHEARLGVGLALGVSAGVVPGWGPELEASLQLEQGPWGVAVALRHWLEQGQSVEGRRVLVTATGGRAAALFRIAPALDALAGLELNRLVGEGAADVRGSAADVAWQLAPVLGLNVITMDIGYLRLELGALARLPVLRPRFVVTGFGTLYRAPAIGADAIIRGVLLFW